MTNQPWHASRDKTVQVFPRFSYCKWQKLDVEAWERGYPYRAAIANLSQTYWAHLQNYGRSQEVETTLRQLKYVNWLVQKQSTFMYHWNQMMHSSRIHIRHTKSWRYDSVGVSLAIYSQNAVAGDLKILGGTQLQKIKMCRVLHRSWIPQNSYWTSADQQHIVSVVYTMPPEPSIM